MRKCVVCGKPVGWNSQICPVCMDEVCEAEDRFGLDELEQYAADMERKRKEKKGHGKTH